MNQPVEILITVPFNEEQISQLKGVSPRLKITHLKAKTAEEIPAEVWEKIEVLYTDSLLPAPEQAPNLRWIQFHWSGVDHVARNPLLQNPELTATTLSGAVAGKMAEFAVLMMLALGHHLPALQETQRQAQWPADRWKRFTPLELNSATVGIVGYGSIGREISRLLFAFGAQVLATKRDPMHPQDNGYTPEGTGDPEGDLVYRLYPAEAIRSMLKECDFVVVTVPLTPENYKLIGAGELAAMKSGAYLIDISRGGVVDAEALYTALHEKRISGAALDVHAEEPLPADSPFWKLPNVIITPHISGHTPQYNQRAVELFTENLHRYLADVPLYNRFDPEKGY
jgi:phosphoglycerate dehydrogenase-like enzyme